MDLNIGNSSYSNEEIESMLQEAVNTSEALRNQLSKIKIKINSSGNAHIIKSIRNVFGESYIDDKGNSYITYDMYCTIMNLMRTLGNAKAGELL